MPPPPPLLFTCLCTHLSLYDPSVQRDIEGVRVQSKKKRGRITGTEEFLKTLEPLRIMAIQEQLNFFFFFKYSIYKMYTKH